MTRFLLESLKIILRVTIICECFIYVISHYEDLIEIIPDDVL